MLLHKNRIVKKEDFARIHRYGRSCFSGNIELRIAETRRQEIRVGFVVGLKFSKKAVERNQAKRWISEIFRSQLPQLKKNQDILVLLKKDNSEQVRKNKLEEDVKRAIEKAGITIEVNN